jgi:hypothetical protein
MNIEAIHELPADELQNALEAAREHIEQELKLDNDSVLNALADSIKKSLVVLFPTFTDLINEIIDANEAAYAMSWAKIYPMDEGIEALKKIYGVILDYQESNDFSSMELAVLKYAGSARYYHHERTMKAAMPDMVEGAKAKQRRSKGGRAPKKAEGVLLWIEQILHTANDKDVFNSIKAKGTWNRLRRKYTFDREQTDFIDTDEMAELERGPYELPGTLFSFYFDGIRLIQVIAETDKHPEKTKVMTEKTFTHHFNTIKKSMLK